MKEISAPTLPLLLRRLAGGLLTLSLAGACYLLWTKAPSLFRGTFAQELRLLLGGLAVFCFLPLGNRIWAEISSCLTKKPGQD